MRFDKETFFKFQKVNGAQEFKINESDSLEDYSGQFKLRLPRSLHRLLAEHSKEKASV